MNNLINFSFTNENISSMSFYNAKVLHCLDAFRFDASLLQFLASNRKASDGCSIFASQKRTQVYYCAMKIFSIQQIIPIFAMSEKQMISLI